MIPILSDRENKDMMKCVRGDRASCPGHGPNKRKCVYTSPFPEGLWIPCKNLDVPPDGPCDHVPRCRDIRVGEDSEEIGKKRQIPYNYKQAFKKPKHSYNSSEETDCPNGKLEIGEREEGEDVHVVNLEEDED